MRKIIISAVVVIVVVIVGITIYKNSSGKLENSNSKIPTAVVTSQNIQSTVSGSGSIIPVNSESIKASGSDTVYQVLVSKDQAVTAGQQLVTFENGSAAITAPYDGIISQVNISGGDSVRQDQPLLSMFDNRNFYTTISVDEMDVTSLKIGQKANIKVNAFPDANFTGTVKDISQQGTYSNGVSTFNVTVYFDKINSAKSGMSTDVSIVTASKDNVLAVPMEAIRDVNGKRFVILSQNNKNKKMKEVKIGINNGKDVEILEGLAAGDKVQVPQTENQSGNKTFKVGKNGFGMMGGGGNRKQAGGNN